MDMQLVTCENFIHYLTKYVTKAEPEELEKIDNKFGTIGGYLKIRNYGLPEIVFYLFTLPITRFSRKVVKVGVSRELINKRCLKTYKSMKLESDDSIDLFYSNAIEKYLNRDEDYYSLSLYLLVIRFF